jgi:hypothetical protein
MRDWSGVWHQFIVTLAPQLVGVVLAVWTGLALIIVMALAGLLRNLFPGSVFQHSLEKMPEHERKSLVVPFASALPPKTAPVAVSSAVQAAVPPESATVMAARKQQAKRSPGFAYPKTAIAKTPRRGRNPFVPRLGVDGRPPLANEVPQQVPASPA